MCDTWSEACEKAREKGNPNQGWPHSGLTHEFDSDMPETDQKEKKKNIGKDANVVTFKRAKCTITQ